ncbi:MAG: DUF4332 domain-containing protein [Longimicrobiales bacterium]
MRRQAEAKATATAALVLGVVLVAGAFLGLEAGVEPFATWFYVFAWAGTLLAADGVVALGGGPPGAQRGRFLLLSRPAFLISLFAWSALHWLFFELLNFRLRNWYYVFLPSERATRWVGTLLSFGTVLPAILTAETLLAQRRFAERVRWPRLAVTPALLRALPVAALVMLALMMLAPRVFFPLVWGVLTLWLEPFVYRRAPERSLLGDLEAGRPARVLRLLAGGLGVGLFWELYNIRARTKWIYTVPGLEELKLFEMPLLGFLGFAPFALDCFVVWQALVVARLAVPRLAVPGLRIAPRRVAVSLACALPFCALVLAGMERWTIASYRPRLSAIVGAGAGVALQRAELDAFSLAAARPRRVAELTGADARQAARWIERARLATLRGIGTENARLLERVGIGSVEALAAARPGIVVARLRSAGCDPVPARVRVWVRAARRATDRPVS